VAANGASRSHWHSFDGYLQAMVELHGRADLCGVATYASDWWVSYALMERGVAAYLARTPEQMEKARSAANAILTDHAHLSSIADTTRTQCWGELCLLCSDNACRPQDGADAFEINTAIER